MPQSMVHIENLVKRYGDLTALNHLDISVLSQGSHFM